MTEVEMLALAKTGDHVAQTALLKLHEKAVAMWARRYAKRCRSADYDDLFQAGSLGLLKAAEKFDPDNGTKFITYAFVWIRSMIGKECERAKLIHIPWNLPATERPPHNFLSLDFTDDEGNRTLVLEGREPGESPFAAEDLELLKAVIGKLPAREQAIVRQRVFEHKTLQEVGDEQGVSRERVRQIYDEALVRLKHELGVAIAERERAARTRLDKQHAEVIETSTPISMPTTSAVRRTPMANAMATRETVPALRENRAVTAVGDWQAATTPELKTALTSALNALADKCLEVARIIYALEQRGESMADVKKMLGWAFHVLRRMAVGQVSPVAFQRFAGARYLLECVANLRTEDQELLARGEKVPLVANTGVCRLVDPLGLSRMEIQQVFASDRIRSEAEQLAFRQEQIETLPLSVRSGSLARGDSADRQQEKRAAAVTVRSAEAEFRPEKAPRIDPLAAAQQGAAADVAELVAEMIASNPNPHAVICHLLRQPSFFELIQKAMAVSKSA